MMTTQNQFRVELVTQHQVSKLTRQLAHQIQASGFKPEVVVAIARGGYIPARLLCDHLDIYNLASMRIAHYTGAEISEQARMSIPLNIDVKDMNVLLVDDISDTGDTLQVALDHINDMQPRDLKVAVLHHKVVSRIVPDYYAKKIVRWRWITYPWAVIEDTLGFVSKMQPRPVSIDEAIARIQKDYGIRIKNDVMEDVFCLLP